MGYIGGLYAGDDCCATCKDWEVNLSPKTTKKLPRKSFCCNFGNLMPETKPNNICKWYNTKEKHNE